MRLTDQQLGFIKGFEGFSATPYDDGTGVRTIGYGTTEADIKPLPRRMSEQQASKLLAERLDKKYEPAARALFSGPHPLPYNDHRYLALVDVAYNLGVGALEGAPGFETLGERITAARMKPTPANLKALADALLLYSNPHDPAVHAGLLRRRKAERALFLRPMGRFEGFKGDEREWITTFDTHVGRAAWRAGTGVTLARTMRTRARHIALKVQSGAWDWNTFRARTRHDALMRRVEQIHN